mmetsp:Transcript_17161/g.42416  ORF Transcript_17161/g.42416 Transcript_17161/m.42416 type:complete len:282 (+) Transcript_17161:376-1221(+)
MRSHSAAGVWGEAPLRYQSASQHGHRGATASETRTKPRRRGTCEAPPLRALRTAPTWPRAVTARAVTARAAGAERLPIEYLHVNLPGVTARGAGADRLPIEYRRVYLPAPAAAAAAAEAVEEAAWLRCRCPGDAGVTVGETRPGGHPLRAPCPRPRHRPRHSRHRSLWWYRSRMPRLPLWPPSLQPDLIDSSRVSIPYLNIWRASPYFHRLRHSPLPPSPGAAPCTSTSPAAGLAAADCLPIATPAAALGRERRAPGQTTARARTPRAATAPRGPPRSTPC